ncbi:cupin domain-containing protein [Thermohalobacter berrensis]|uniref:Cupin n=1 Tax=Thermohalobacter berrensis TaxID=99594 RepID=A0A419T8Q4_9FIRM|nr:cupin domain-containing protein [Thermohalobacter berrensis]RKD33934.1 cupin [Thermohalobacter berrensis]
MIVSHEKDLEGKRIEGEGIKKAIKKVLISPEEGWEGHVMRVFELEEGGHTPKHTHPWPHINYIVRGKGILHLDGKDYEVEEGSFAYVPSNKIHQFSNRGKDNFAFICIVPEEGDK